MNGNVQKAIEAIVCIDNQDDLKRVSGFLRSRWNDLSKAKAAEFSIGDKVRIKGKGRGRGRVGTIVRFGPKNIIVIVKTPVAAGRVLEEKWRVPPSLLEPAPPGESLAVLALGALGV